MLHHCTTSDDDPVALTLECLGEHAEWLRVGTITDGIPADATTLSGLTDHGGTGLDTLLERWRRRAGDIPTYASADVLTNAAWLLYAPRLLTLRARRVLVDLDPAAIHLVLPLGDDDAPHGVVWPGAVRTESIAPDDAAIRSAYRSLADEAVTALEPLVAAVRSRVSLGRRALWGRVVDTFYEVGPRYADPDPEPLMDELALVEDALRGTILARRPATARIERPDGTRLHVRTTACCHAYRDAHLYAHEGDPLPWHGERWADYCFGCPLIPMAETVRRARHWLDEEARS